MKKRQCILLALVLTAAVLVGVAGRAASNSGTQLPLLSDSSICIGQTHTDIEKMKIRISNVVCDEDGARLNVQWINETGCEVVYGESYFIEREENGQWVSCAVEDELVFTTIGYVLSHGQTRTKSYDLTGLFDISQPGKYRFRTGCHIQTGKESQECRLWAEFTVSGNEQATSLEYGVQYIRTDGSADGVAFPGVCIIRSVEELNDYYKNNKDTFDLERKDKVYADTTIGFLDACDRYDETYFESKYLVFVLLEEGSGSIQHDVTQVGMTQSGQHSVNINSIVPEVGTCDMAQWHIILELNRTAEASSEADVLVYLDDVLAAGTVNKIVQPYISYANSPFTEPPELKLVSDGNSQPASLSTYTWSYAVGDGMWRSVCVDCIHPLDCKEHVTGFEVSECTATLAFEEDPDLVSVWCWPDSQWGNNMAQSEEADIDGLELRLKPGGYIYEVAAQWDNDGGLHHGTVDYYFYVIYDENG